MPLPEPLPVGHRLEAYAEFTIDFAYNAIEESEYAVLDAVLASMDADAAASKVPSSVEADPKADSRLIQDGWHAVAGLGAATSALCAGVPR